MFQQKEVLDLLLLQLLHKKVVFTTFPTCLPCPL